MRRACALVFALVPCAAAAAEIPACGPATAGAVTCMAGRMCACAYERPGRMTGTPGGWRWDCGILRPACGGGPEVPATTSAGPTPWWPGSLEVELTPRRRPRD
ncbi:MAG: hypothetical protein NZ704_14135 [Geminicoccaceae bacterium]|nr:hypothetical protein [Geminicoccaceae bacterium]